MKKKITGIMLLAALFLAVSVQAADNLQFKGNLIIPNCTINKNNPIETDFGDIEIQTITSMNGGHHWKEIKIPVDCPYNIGKPRLIITGLRGEAHHGNALQTSKFAKEKLVVYLRAGTPSSLGSFLDLNKEHILDNQYVTGSGASKTIHMTAAVGREGGMELLTPGPFTASANMVFRYE
ncbi:fimbrial protein [Escherichia coli]|uniref:fimbrial protein n=1 Tax=Escherichia coli TaxID=562 RepID=UPI003C785BEF